MKRIFHILAAALVIAGCASNSEEKLTSKVNPMIGSGGHGHVFVGANVPFGMVQLGPHQLKDTWDWCSGYHISDTLILGFSHTHLSGTGIGELGDVLLLPFDPAKTLHTTGWVHHKKREIGHIYAHLDHNLESIRPGFYSVELPDYGVKARLTATERVGFHEYTFSSEKSAILMDLCTGIGWDACTDNGFTVMDENRIEGFRRSSGWANDHIWYFAAEFSSPVTDIREEPLENDGKASILYFDTHSNKKVYVKVAISPVSCENAWNNMKAELPGWDFDTTAEVADAKWEQALSKVNIQGLDPVQEEVFYTALYHTMITPELFSDTDGSYRGADGKVHSSELNQYTILSLWDTYRAQFPLISLIHPDIAESLADTYLNIFNEQGKLPVWHLDGAETDCMVGNPGVIAMTDLILKGYSKDPKAAYRACVASSELDERGLDAHRRYGFIPYDKTKETETVAKSMEFGIADGCVAKVAKIYGTQEEVDRYTWRSQAYRRYFDKESGFIRGRNLAGKFRTPFNPYRAEWLADDYTEGNAWQYTFLAPHDVAGLIETFGGEQRFTEKIDSLFIAEGDLGETAADVTGLVGQYAHGNEPSHHIAYMYNWLPGQQYKCAEKVRHIMKELYFDDENGVCGNEDCGQMSAWYVLSALGLYQVDPACGDFAIGSPAVKSAKVQLAGGTLNIKAVNNSDKNIYVQKVIFNGKVLERPFISYSELVKGGELEYIMGPFPKPTFSEHRSLEAGNLGEPQTKRTELIWYDSRKDALKKPFEKSSNYTSLGGEWNFRFYDSTEAFLADPDKAPSKIQVPGNWERQGFGTAVYTNTCYDFCPKDPQPPVLPEAIPTGVYSRSFKADFKVGERLHLNIGGLKGGAYTFINNVFIGYTDDAKSLVRYDITPLVKRGAKNELKIVVTQWSVGSYLECQDFWRLSGIERDVYLSRESESIPAGFDWNVVSTLKDDMSTGDFRLSLCGDKPFDFSFELLDKNGSEVASARNIHTSGCWESAVEIPGVRQWTAETPELYTLVLKVGDKYTRAEIGFRRLEIKGNLFLVNGQPVKFKGVNLHEHNQYTGHYITRKDALEDLRIMRENNINGIRTCHYPQPRFFYELCDSLGFYVYSEANVESHGMGYHLDRTLGNNPAWYDRHIDRITNMYYRTRNYPCVTILSLGNEAGNGVNFYKAYEELKALEKDGQNRPVCYERAEFEYNTDMLVPQYPGADWFRRMGEEGSDRPVCPSEYAHAMGNSTGSLDLQWKYIYQYPNLQGGFIWDWVDQGLFETDSEGKPYWTYGGDYGYHSPSDGNFLCNGLVGPDREPHPGMAEVKHVYQDVTISYLGEGKFSAFNRFHFTSLDKYKTDWTVTADGKEIAGGSLRLKAAPQTSEEFSIALPELPSDKECHINFVTYTTAKTALLKKGHVIAYDQIELQKAQRAELVSDSAVEAGQNGGILSLDCGKARIEFDLTKGYLSSYTLDGKDLFNPEFGMRPSFWRAPNDNDYGCWWPGRTQVFKTSSREFNCFAYIEGNSIKAVYSLASGNVFTVSYTLAGEALKLDYSFTGKPSREAVEVPRIGFRMRLPASADKFCYYGRGPQENYCDRFSGYMVGLYESSASAEFVPYVRPQECGHHTGCDMLAIGGFKVLGEDFEFSALRQSIEDLDSEESVKNDYQYDYKDPKGNYTPEAARNNLRRHQHICDIVDRDFVELCIDGAQSGIGGYDSWGARAEKERTLWSDRSYSFSFTIVPDNK